MLWKPKPGCKIRDTCKAVGVMALAAVLPGQAVGDHVPDNLSQDLDPNYVACIMTVDGATAEFRDELQSTCIRRMGDICSGRNGVALPSQVIGCLSFETQRGTNFLTAAAVDLPKAVEKSGLFGRSYERRRLALMSDAESLVDRDNPETIEAVLQQSVSMTSAVLTLFWLARETNTPLQKHVEKTFVAH